MKTNRVQTVNKIAIRGDRKEPIIVALLDIKLHKPELYRELEKVLDIELWDGYSLQIHEEE